jgi:hypothetical protein
MQSRPTKFTFKVKRETNNDVTSSSLSSPPVLEKCTKEEEILISSSEKEEAINSSSSSEEAEEAENENNKNDDDNDDNNQLVVYSASTPNEDEGIVNAHPIGYRTPGKILPSVGAFTVQCANCFKWRLIPTKEKYEEIREHILEQPFVCEAAREWRPDIKCEDEADIQQDGSRLWAIDKPNISQPPPGWQRLLRIRSKESSKFADVYYAAPSGKRLRSMVEIQRFLAEHPEYSEGISMSQFSFQIPKPLQKDYVRQRKPPKIDAYIENNNDINSSFLQLPPPHLMPANVAPISAVGPTWTPGLQLGGLYDQMVTPPPPESKKLRRAPPDAIHLD